METTAAMEAAPTRSVGAPPVPAAGARRVHPTRPGAPAVVSGDELLRQVPGLSANQHGSEGKGLQLYLRGFDAAHGADIEARWGVMPLNELSNIHGQGYLDLGFVLPETLLALDVQRGVSQLGQGPFALAGSLHLRPGVRADERGWRVALDQSHLGRTRVLGVAAPEEAPVETFAAVEAVLDRGFGPRRGLTRANASGAALLWQQADTRVLGAGFLSTSFFELPGVALYAPWERGERGFFETLSDDQQGQSLQAGSTLELLHRGALEGRAGLWLRGRSLRLTENYTGAFERPELGDLRDQRHDSLATGLRGDLRVPLTPRLDWESGAETRLEFVDSSERYRPQEEEALRDLRGFQSLASASTGLAAHPHPRLRARLGARVDTMGVRATDRRVDERGGGLRAIASPRASLAWQAAAPLTLLVGAGRGVRPPEAGAFLPARTPTDAPGLSRPTDIATATAPDRTGPIGPPSSPAPPGSAAAPGPAFASAWSVDTGALLQPTPWLRLETTLFGAWVDDELLFDHVARANVAAGATRRLGVESGAEVRLAPDVVIAGDITWVDARFGGGRPIPNVPPLLASTELRVTPAPVEAGLRFTHVGGRALPFGARSAGYQLLDLRAGARLGPVDLALQVDNLLDVRWREGEYVYPSRWAPDPSADVPLSPVPRLHYSAGRPRTFRLLAILWFARPTDAASSQPGSPHVPHHTH